MWWDYNKKKESVKSSIFKIKIYDRLRSVSELKLSSTPQISIHWRHYLKSLSNLMIFSNLCPFQILRSMADLFTRVRAYISDISLKKWEIAIHLRIWHRFENLKKDINLKIECQYMNLKKGYISEVQISVT